MQELSTVVAYLEALGIHHLDLHEDNILIIDQRHVCILDYSVLICSGSPSARLQDEKTRGNFLRASKDQLRVLVEMRGLLLPGEEETDEIEFRHQQDKLADWLVEETESTLRVLSHVTCPLVHSAMCNVGV